MVGISVNGAWSIHGLAMLLIDIHSQMVTYFRTVHIKDASDCCIASLHDIPV